MHILVAPYSLSSIVYSLLYYLLFSLLFTLFYNIFKIFSNLNIVKSLVYSNLIKYIHM